MRTTTFFTLLATQLLLSTVNAISNSVSLVSFAPIPAPAKSSVICDRQYDATIIGCSTADFAKGAACSSGCRTALLNTQNNIKLACFDVSVDAKTLLGEIFQDQIIQALCDISLATTTPNQASTAAQSTTSKAVSTTSTSATAAASSAIQTTPNSVQTTSSATTDAASSSSSSSISSALAVASTSAASAPPPADTPTGAQVVPKLTSQQIQIQAMSHSGGGSPFDIISTSDADKKTMSSFAAVIVVGAIMMLAR